MLSDQPSETHAIVNALRNVAFEDGATLVRFLHHDPGRYSSFGGLGETAKYTVGRSMYETDSVPAHWVELCNDASLVEEVWVPTRFNALTFAQAGVSPDRLHVLPEPVDTGDPSHCTWDVERRGEFSPLGSLAGCFLALGSGLGLVGTASSRR